MRALGALIPLVVFVAIVALIVWAAVPVAAIPVRATHELVRSMFEARRSEPKR